MRIKLLLLLAFCYMMPGCKDISCFKCQLRYQSNGKEVPQSAWPATYIEGCDDTTESHLEANPIYLEDGAGNAIHDYYWDCN
jgi:hypothetical protein